MRESGRERRVSLNGYSSNFWRDFDIRTHAQHFHEVAYSALMADDLLDAIDVFLDDSIVLPPGDWDENLLLPVMHQRNEMRKRKGPFHFASLVFSRSHTHITHEHITHHT